MQIFWNEPVGDKVYIQNINLNMSIVELWDILRAAARSLMSKRQL